MYTIYYSKICRFVYVIYYSFVVHLCSFSLFSVKFSKKKCVKKGENEMRMTQNVFVYCIYKYMNRQKKKKLFGNPSERKICDKMNKRDQKLHIIHGNVEIYTLVLLKHNDHHMKGLMVNEEKCEGDFINEMIFYRLYSVLFMFIFLDVLYHPHHTHSLCVFLPSTVSFFSYKCAYYRRLSFYLFFFFFIYFLTYCFCFPRIVLRFIFIA